MSEAHDHRGARQRAPQKSTVRASTAFWNAAARPAAGGYIQTRLTSILTFFASGPVISTVRGDQPRVKIAESGTRSRRTTEDGLSYGTVGSPSRSAAAFFEAMASRMRR